MRRTFARWAAAAVVGSLLVVLPTIAMAATFTNHYPMGTVAAPPQLVGVTAFSAVALDTRSASIAVDGTAYATLLRAGSTGGYWSATEVWNPTLQVWTVRWTWVPLAGEPNKSTLYAYPVFSPMLADGTHVVTATIKDRNGATFTDSWSFVYGSGPVLGAPTPADGSVVDTVTPAITIPVTDNGPGAVTATATINGSDVDATVFSNTVRLASITLPNDASVAVTVTVTDSSGIRASKSWSFSVQMFPEMPSTVSACAQCHPGYEDDPDMHADCLVCHSGMVDKPHDGAPTGYHTKADVSACSGCHVSDITVEHARHTDAGGAAYTCVTCHMSSDPLVTGAIGAGVTACSACHPSPDHNALHDHANAAFCAKSGCHVATNLVVEHITAPINPTSVATCADCHESTVPAVVAAIAAGTKDCVACHGQMLSGHDAMHETVMDAECLYCHSGSISAEHIVLHNTGGERTCASCHESTEQDIVDAIADGDASCGRCHDDAGHNVGHASDFTAQDCAGCHVSNVQTEHHRATASSAAGRCANCHLTPTSTAVDALGGAAWARGCAQGGCHPPAGTTEMHGDILAEHEVGAPAPSCIGAGCHAGTDLSVIHSSASTTTPSGTRTGCLVCHSDSALPASDQCADCHPDRLLPHGYDPAKHQATEPCLAACHNSELGPAHTGSACSSCHPSAVGEIAPWDDTCTECHELITHTPPPGAHVGNDSGFVTSRNYGCDGLPGMTCHNISDVSTLHAFVHDGSGGCGLCHGEGATPSTACETCHGVGSGGDTSWMHHNNNKYVADPADIEPGSYFTADPAGGWNDEVYYYDCMFCHGDMYGIIQAPPSPIIPYAGERMYHSDLRYGARDTALQIATITVPAAATLDFMTFFDAELDFDYGYVEVSTDGTTWVPLASEITTTTNPYGQNLGNGITGTSGGWVPASFDLSDYSGQQVSLRFRYVSDGYVNMAGFAVDNVVINSSAGVLFSDDAEADNPNVTHLGWVRVGPYPPAILPDDPFN